MPDDHLQRILLAEDNPGDVMLVEEALRLSASESQYHATCYFQKPADLAEFMELGAVVKKRARKRARPVKIHMKRENVLPNAADATRELRARSWRRCPGARTPLGYVLPRLRYSRMQ